ncbi:hypothetical protein C8R47DRAFT_695564 [Mycena vitilis]|nr:hypothetical protein C8R47DRAFT_695564 [Mycena vitilis]
MPLLTAHAHEFPLDPEPLEPHAHVFRPGVPIAPVGSSKCVHATRVKVRAMSAVALFLWGVNISLSLVESFHLESSQLQFRILLVWATCSGLFVVLAAAAFVSTLMRLPSRPFVSFLQGVMIVMSATSCIVGFAVLFPVIAECAGSGCSSKERALRLFVCAVNIFCAEAQRADFGCRAFPWGLCGRGCGFWVSAISCMSWCR